MAVYRMQNVWKIPEMVAEAAVMLLTAK